MAYTFKPFFYFLIKLLKNPLPKIFMPVLLKYCYLLTYARKEDKANMYNYFMLIGIVTSDFELQETQEGKKVMTIILSCCREFKNQDGQYIYDKFKITLWDFLAETAYETCKKGAKIGIKGRLLPRWTKDEETGFLSCSVDLIADKLIDFTQEDVRLKPILDEIKED